MAEHSSHSKKPVASRGKPVHISEAVAAFFENLKGKAEEGVERTGGFEGRVRPRQRPWSRILDQLVHEEHAA